MKTYIIFQRFSKAIKRNSTHFIYEKYKYIFKEAGDTRKK